MVRMAAKKKTPKADTAPPRPRWAPPQRKPIDSATWDRACYAVLRELNRLVQVAEDGGIRKGDPEEIVDFNRAYFVAHAALQTMRGTLPGDETDPREIAKRNAVVMKAYEELGTHPTEVAVEAVIDAALIVQATESSEKREGAARDLLTKLASHPRVGDVALVPVATARGGSHFRRDHRGPGLRS